LDDETVTVTENGNDGNSVTEVTNWYLAAKEGVVVSHDTVASDDTTNWIKNNIPTDYGPELKCLWNYEEVSFDGKDPIKTTPAIIGIYGTDGRSIGSIEEYYNTSTTIDSVPTTWIQVPGEEMPVVDATNKYLWNYEIVKDTNGKEITKTTPVIIGVYGDEGDKGDSTEQVFLYAYTLSSTQINSLPTGGSPDENNWKTKEEDNATKTNCYMYRASVLKKTTTTYTSGVTSTKTSYIWTEPFLYKAWNENGVN
jgi:hypothetical protein